jgi:Divergent InlB B-repeat domain
MVRNSMIALAAALVVAASPAHRAVAALQPSDDGEPVASISSPLDSSESLQVVVRGAGTVRGAGFNCTQTCSGSFKKGQWIALAAQEANGYRFAGWERACGRAPQSHSCGFRAGDVHLVSAVFVPLVAVAAPTLSPGVGVKDGHTMRKVAVQFEVASTSVVTYELRQNGTVLWTWHSSPFVGRSLRTIWIDDSIPAGTYDLGLRISTGTQVKSFHGTVVLGPPQP